MVVVVITVVVVVDGLAVVGGFLSRFFNRAEAAFLADFMRTLILGFLVLGGLLVEEGDWFGLKHFFEIIWFNSMT